MIDRMLRAARLSSGLYQEVEGDRDATVQALVVVIIVAIATGIGQASAGIGGLVVGTISAIAGWILWAWITYLVGTRLLNTPATNADWGQLARTTGFAQSPGVLRILGFIPVLGGIILLVTIIWQLIAMVIAVREALDYTSTGRAIAVVIIGFIPYLIMIAILGAIFRF